MQGKYIQALGLEAVVLWLENSNYLLCHKHLELLVAVEHLNTESTGFIKAIKHKEDLKARDRAYTGVMIP